MNTVAFDSLIAVFAEDHDARWSASGTDTGPPRIRTHTYRFDDKEAAEAFVKDVTGRTGKIKGSVRKAPEQW